MAFSLRPEVKVPTKRSEIRPCLHEKFTSLYGPTICIFSGRICLMRMCFRIEHACYVRFSSFAAGKLFTRDFQPRCEISLLSIWPKWKLGAQWVSLRGYHVNVSWHLYKDRSETFHFEAQWNIHVNGLKTRPGEYQPWWVTFFSLQ